MHLQQRAGDGSLLGCGHEPVHPFLQWLDPLPYTLLPGGDFESGAAGWKLSGGARVVDGNEPFYVTKRADSHSLLLPAGQLGDEPADVHGPRPPDRPLLLDRRRGAVLAPRRGRLHRHLGPPAVTRSPSRRPADKSWSPSLPALQLLGTVNALTLNGLTSEIALRFTPRGLLFGSGTWQLDDVYVDPWKVI